MQLTPDVFDHDYFVRAYGPGYVQVNQVKLNRSAIITPNQLIESWEPRSLEDLTINHFDCIFKLQFSIVLLGHDESSSFCLDQEIIRLFQSKRMSLELMTLGAACRTYNLLVSEHRRVAAALLIGYRENQ